MMGVEPTEQHLSMCPIGFEDRGQHQPSNTCHFSLYRAFKFSEGNNATKIGEDPVGCQLGMAY